MVVAPRARRFTVEEYEHMVTHGYTGVRPARRGERVSPLAFPDVALPVDDILG